jgi:hypothetical protein
MQDEGVCLRFPAKWEVAGPGSASTDGTEAHPPAAMPPGGENQVGQVTRSGTAFRAFCHERRSASVGAAESIWRSYSPNEEHVSQQGFANLLVKI